MRTMRWKVFSPPDIFWALFAFTLDGYLSRKEDDLPGAESQCKILCITWILWNPCQDWEHRWSSSRENNLETTLLHGPILKTVKGLSLQKAMEVCPWLYHWDQGCQILAYSPWCYRVCSGLWKISKSSSASSWLIGKDYTTHCKLFKNGCNSEMAQVDSCLCQGSLVELGCLLQLLSFLYVHLT